MAFGFMKISKGERLLARQEPEPHVIYPRKPRPLPFRVAVTACVEKQNQERVSTKDLTVRRSLPSLWGWNSQAGADGVVLPGAPAQLLRPCN